jgi:FkbM family methyltransferase
MQLDEYEKIQPTVVVDGMRFNVPNSHIAWRVQTMYTKEPDTVAWIQGMKEGEVFYDVGANIGLYTMLAAKQGLHVFAFEPESQNYAVLIRNLAFNTPMTNKAVAFPFCISDEQRIDTLRLSNLMAGGSCHSFASDLNYKREEKQWAYKQGTVGFTLDSLVFECGLPTPHHIKVDVDGFEDKVVAGAAKLLPSVQSVLLELDSANADHMRIRDRLVDMGFVTDEQQIELARRKQGPFTGIGNIIFKRPSGTVQEAKGAAQDTVAD